MQKALPYIAIAGIVIAVIVIFNTSDVQASSKAVILPISVLAQSTTNYGIDSSFSAIPAISMNLIEDKIKDDAGKSARPQGVTYPPGDTVTRQNSPNSSDPINIVSTQVTIDTTQSPCGPGNGGCGGGSGNGPGPKPGKGKGPGPKPGTGKGPGPGPGKRKGPGPGPGKGKKP